VIYKRMAGIIEDAILYSRYLLYPLSVALLFRIVTIIIDFYKVMIGRIAESVLNDHTLVVLQLLDIMMIANLIWLISAGSYYVFINNGSNGDARKKRPQCLHHISSGILKEKMAGSLIGVSSVHMLQVFLHLQTEQVGWSKIGQMLTIHMAFIVGLLAFAYINAQDHHDHRDEKEVENVPVST
jgi:uncharacterized protein (TIGR00645 family)